MSNNGPSLLQGSVQLHRITKIKTDMGDNTISISTLIVKAPNADFDGDEPGIPNKYAIFKLKKKDSKE